MNAHYGTQVYLARVVAVDTKNHTVSIAIQSDEDSVWENVQLMVPYAHATEGSGSMAMPEVGASCQVMFPNDRQPPIIIGYMKPIAPGEGQSGGLPEMEQGDQVLVAGNQGYIICRRCGVLEIGATPLSSVMFIPIKNLIRAFFGNLEIIGGLGNLKWTGDETTGGLRIGVASKSGGVEEVILKAGYIEYGSHSGPSNVFGTSDMRVELIVSPDGGSTTVAGLHISADGNTSFETAENVGFVIKGSWEIELDDYLKLVSKKAVTVESLQDTTFTATGTFKAESKKNLVLKAGSTELLNGTAGQFVMKAGNVQMIKATSAGVNLAGATDDAAMATQVIAALQALAAVVDTLSNGAGSTAIAPFITLIPAKQVKVS